MKYKYSILFILFCIFLFTIVIKWGNYITNNYTYIYNKEGFDINNYSLYRDGDTNTPLTSHTVDLPINTTYQCQNFCGPNSQCSITREQCTSDVDCYGCQPILLNANNVSTKDVDGENDAGKLTYNQNPQYSQLTTDIGTNATIYNKKLALVPKPYYGVDYWMKSANVGMQLFKNKENYMFKLDPSKSNNMPKYPVRESPTGLFEDYGPLPANAYL